MFEKTYPTMPTMSPLAKKYLSLQNIYDELQKQNEAIFAQEHKRSELEIELSECNGAFKARKWQLTTGFSSCIAENA